MLNHIYESERFLHNAMKHFNLKSNKKIAESFSKKDIRWVNSVFNQ